ncbi:unnamed protein product, partial [marine sediment metagenome]
MEKVPAFGIHRYTMNLFSGELDIPYHLPEPCQTELEISAKEDGIKRTALLRNSSSNKVTYFLSKTDEFRACSIEIGIEYRNRRLSRVVRSLISNSE